MNYRNLAYQTAQKYGLDPDMFVRQIQAESAFNPAAVSSAGAIGLGQLMPATAKELGVDPTDPVQNLEGAARYMKQQLDRFGDPALALAAYNAGPSRVAKAGGIPKITETQNYVAKILGGKGGASMANQPTQPQQSQGLLGGLLGGQGIGGALGLSDDFRDRLKMGLLLGSDPQRFAPMVAGMQQAAKERRAMARTTEQANRTIEFLQQRGRDDLAQAVLTGAIDPSSAVQAAMAQPKDTRTAAMREYEYAQRDPKFAEFLKLKEPPETPAGLKTLDTEFAKTLGSASGVQALAAARQDAATISKVLKELESGKELTGPVLGILPENVRAMINPDSVQSQQLVEGVVQKNLRAILGGQFAQKEGEQLVRRAYNPVLPEAQNAARLRALFLSLQTAAENKAAMEDYFRKNNFSLKGYEGPMGIPTMAEFEAAMDAAAPAAKTGTTTIGDYTIELVEE